MKTLDLQETVAILKLHPQTVRRMAVAGELPAAKPGKCWAFIAVATLVVLKYYRALKSGLPMRGGTSVSAVSGIRFEFSMRDKGGKMIFDYPVKHVKHMAQADLAVASVQDVASRIPTRQQ